MTFAPAITAEDRIASFMGVRGLEGSGLSWQNLGRSGFLVNTRDTRVWFDKKGNFLSMEYIGEDDDYIVDPETFDWDSLDS